jgi:hypothetical protein
LPFFQTRNGPSGALEFFYDSIQHDKMLANGKPLTVSKIEVRAQICIGICIFLILIFSGFTPEFSLRKKVLVLSLLSVFRFLSRNFLKKDAPQNSQPLNPCGYELLKTQPSKLATLEPLWIRVPQNSTFVVVDSVLVTGLFRYQRG